MLKRSIEDTLREEYFTLLPQLRQLHHKLAILAEHAVLPLRTNMVNHERLRIESRVKECDAAIDKLRRRTEGGVFDPNRRYSLKSLQDLIAIRVLVFPTRRIKDVDKRLRETFPRWRADHIPLLGVLKRHGKLHCDDSVKAEYQIAPMLIGLYWSVEHDALYKPNPALRGVEKHPDMRAKRVELERVLIEFEETFQQVVDEAKQ